MPRRAKAPDGTLNELAIRGKFQANMARWVMDLDGYEITQELDQLLSRVMYGRRRRAEVFLTALIRNHIGRIMFLVSNLPRVEDELLTNERIKAAKTSDLTRLLMAMSQGIESSSDFLRSFVSDADLKSDVPLAIPRRELPSEADEEEEEEGDSEEEKEELAADRDIAMRMSVEARQKLGSIFRRLLTVTGENPRLPVKEVVAEESKTVDVKGSPVPKAKLKVKKKGKK